jgi:hypothetical protein
MEKTMIREIRLLAVLFAFFPPAVSRAESPSPASDPALVASLKKFVQTQDEEKKARYIAVFRDLNDDGKPEAIVYLEGSDWCGSGGCAAMVLGQTAGGWTTIADIGPIRLPVRVLQSKSKGWRDISVAVGGGGIVHGYEAMLPYDGRSYAENPTTAPARRLKGKAAGDVVIPASAKAEPLFP